MTVTDVADHVRAFAVRPSTLTSPRLPKPVPVIVMTCPPYGEPLAGVMPVMFAAIIQPPGRAAAVASRRAVRDSGDCSQRGVAPHAARHGDGLLEDEQGTGFGGRLALPDEGLAEENALRVESAPVDRLGRVMRATPAGVRFPAIGIQGFSPAWG